MTTLTNTTSHTAQIFSFLDANAQEQRVLIVTGTFDVQRDGTVELSEAVQPLRATDEYYGEPSSSSVCFASELAPPKRAVDILVHGSAVAPHGRAAAEVLTRLRLPGLDKRILVSGNRRWSGDRPSRPELFERILLQYERAYGGESPYCAENPVGISAATADRSAQLLGTELPNLEHPDDRVTNRSSRPKPAAYGPIAPWWAPRVKLGGTYDEAWLHDQSPLLPRDFDVRFHQVAPLDQQLSGISAGAQVELQGMTPEGVWRFALPAFAPELRLLYSQRSARLQLSVDTLLLEPELSRFTVTARALLPESRPDPVREIMLGPVTRGRWRSRLTGKPYLHTRE